MTNLLDQTRTQCSFPTSEQFAHSVLIVLDDDSVRQRLSQAMQSFGFKVVPAESISDGLAKIKLCALTYAVVDVRLDDGGFGHHFCT